MPAPRGRDPRRLQISGERTARRAALNVLNEYKRSGWFVGQLIDQEFGPGAASADQRPLAMELINGIVRRQATLDALLLPAISRPRHRIEEELWTLLQLGAYQLVFLGSIPPYAAVNETVSLAKIAGRKGWDGFVNGILRSLERELTDRFVEEPSPHAIPMSGGSYRLHAKAVFRDPAYDPGGYVAAAFSFPRWLVERWRQRFDFAELCRLGFWFNEPARLSLRVNRLRTSSEAVLGMLADAGIRAAPGDLAESIRLADAARVDALPGFADGLFSVQDESAMSAVDLLSPQPGESILDLCAAPGSKTTHLAERMGNRGTIIATDIRLNRLARIEENCRRLGITIVQPKLMRADAAGLPDGPFDAVLVDAPCSNTGVLGKRPEARWRLSADSIEELVQKQRVLLGVALARLKPGGRAVYSTCSIEPEENDQVVHHVLQASSDAALVDQRHATPGRPSDGGYVARIQKG